MPKAVATRCWISSTGVDSRRRAVLGITASISSGLSGLAVSEAWAMHAGQGAVQLADVGVDAPRQLGQHVALGVDPGLANEAAQDGEAGRQVGGLDGDGQAPLEAVAQARLERRELAGDAVGGEDELAAAFVEGVEGVEELVLGVALALEELDVVDEQHVEVAVAPLEPLGAGACAARRRTRW